MDRIIPTRQASLPAGTVGRIDRIIEQKRKSMDRITGSTGYKTKKTERCGNHDCRLHFQALMFFYFFLFFLKKILSILPTAPVNAFIVSE